MRREEETGESEKQIVVYHLAQMLEPGMNCRRSRTYDGHQFTAG